MSDVTCCHGFESRGCPVCSDERIVTPPPQILISGSVNPVEVPFQDTPVYEVIARTPNKYVGLRLGTVRHYARGWKFMPTFQALPSRKFHESAELAVKGRIRGEYELRPMPLRIKD